MIKINAKAICEGYAYAKAFNVISHKISDTSTFKGVKDAVDQLDKAIDLSLKQLKNIKNEDNSKYLFLDAHILLLEDPMLRDEIVSMIEKENLDAITAFSLVIDKYINMMKDSTDSYLQERYLDFLDIKLRVLQNLNKISISLSNLEECILIIEELYPSLLVNISKNVKGIIALKGGFTSHSAILCRARGIPFVVANISDDFMGEVIIENDTIYLNPTIEVKTLFEKKRMKEEVINKDLKDISVYANVVNNEEVKYIPSDFKGIGLYRTEFILMNEEYAFDYLKQVAIYMEALEMMAGKPITFRTFDFGGDKQVEYLPHLKKGIENYYVYRKLFENQIKALLVASKKYPNQVRILFPMIETFKQYQELKKVVVKLAKEEGIKVPSIGMMLETQSAFINLVDFKNVDFISVGTNDLTSELFNVSRDEVILFENLYVEILDVLKKVIWFCNINDIYLSVCGELISKKEFAKKAISLGLKNISISPYFINNIYNAINEGE